MNRIAVFVDSGYLFAQGSVAISGEKKSRSTMNLKPENVIAALKKEAFAKARHCELLRIYWYDGAISNSHPTADQVLIASLDNVKLRLGFINSYGQQKGVDSLIVTDLIELARLKSITDALLLSGDEDVRVGVQIAQNYGVRVHLLGIHPSRGSQSKQLMQESDTTSEWTAETIADFLSIREEAVAGNLAESLTVELTTSEEQKATALIEKCVSKIVEELTEQDLFAISEYWKTERGVPPEFDKKLLQICGKSLGRTLDKPEIKPMRSYFQKMVRERSGKNTNN